MLRKLVLVGLASVVFATTGFCAVEVGELVITTAVVDREPVDSVEVFPRQNGKLYCFSRLLGATGETVIYHLWYRDEQLMSRVALPVNSPNWRTWSAKQLLEDWPGNWRVEVEDSEGNLLSEVKFELR